MHRAVLLQGERDRTDEAQMQPHSTARRAASQNRTTARLIPCCWPARPMAIASGEGFMIYRFMHRD